MASNGVARLVRRAYEGLPDHVREDIRAKRAEFRGLLRIKDNQRMLAMRLAAIEAEIGLNSEPHVPVQDPRFPDGVQSRLCTQADLETPWFTEWCTTMELPQVANRKIWEFAYIAHMFDTLGVLEPGCSGLGFGVGREALVSAFAARGVRVMATDLAADDQEATGWVKSSQHASDIEGLHRPGICDAETFRELVSFRPVDMRAVPTDLRGYDFCWSTCAFEHLGSLDAGLDFVEQSVGTLRPGGYAVHTTEFNVGSNDATLETGPTVVYRERDMLAFRERMEAKGHEVAMFDFHRGTGVFDAYVDVPPFADEPVLRFDLAGFTLTSVGIVIRAGGAGS